mmetsp:Transcript_637/g.1710  ORF Transcript_637/g.1710 Transcript_637/m.1710 type:complete len:207 (+) Transcript_637:1401-2021(+)
MRARRRGVRGGSWVHHLRGIWRSRPAPPLGRRAARRTQRRVGHTSRKVLAQWHVAVRGSRRANVHEPWNVRVRSHGKPPSTRGAGGALRASRPAGRLEVVRLHGWRLRRSHPVATAQHERTVRRGEQGVRLRLRLRLRRRRGGCHSQVGGGDNCRDRACQGGGSEGVVVDARGGGVQRVDPHPTVGSWGDGAQGDGGGEGGEAYAG